MFNLLLAAPLHGDQVKGHDYVATLLVFGGVAVCLANANTESIERTYSELIALTTRTQFHMWLGLLATGFTVAIAHLRTAPATARPSLPAGVLNDPYCTVRWPTISLRFRSVID